MNHLRTAYKYIRHYFTARHSYGFGIHSPFIFYFTRFIIYEKNPFYIFRDIEKLRSELKKDKRLIYVADFGMGESGKRKVKDIVSHSLKSPKYGQLLFRISKFCKCNTILELGTSLGITTTYLASANTTSRCVTMEGSAEIAKIAQQNLDLLSIKNVDIVVGNINEKLTSVVSSSNALDLIFIDANHCSEAVLNYFDQCLFKVHNNTVLVIDDIYWSKDMEYAWQMIKKHHLVTSTIDMFQLGIVFFNTDLHKKNYKIRF